MNLTNRRVWYVILIVCLAITLSACGDTPTPHIKPAPTSSVPTPTASPIPSATGETPVAAGCELVANAQTTVYQRPSLDAEVFGTLSPGDRVAVGATTADGWIGFDPGTAQAANVGVFRLRWVQPGDAISLEGTCQDLPVVVGPPAGVCFTMAMEDIPVYSEPDASSALLVTMHSGDYAQVVSSAGAWFQIDLSVGNLAQNQMGWISSQYVNFNGPCDSLPVGPTPVTPPPASRCQGFGGQLEVQVLVGPAEAVGLEPVAVGIVPFSVITSEPPYLVEGQGPISYEAVLEQEWGTYTVTMDMETSVQGECSGQAGSEQLFLVLEMTGEQFVEVNAEGFHGEYPWSGTQTRDLAFPLEHGATAQGEGWAVVLLLGSR
jgi:hypothetical protein